MFFYQLYCAGALLLLCFALSRFCTLWLLRKSLDTLSSIAFVIPGGLCSIVGAMLGYAALVEANTI